MNAVDTIAFLAGSEQRAAIIATLRRAGPLTRSELADRCDAARVTVSRNLEQLRERDLAVTEGGEHHLTPVGKLLAEEFCSFLETVETAGELAPVLRHVPPDEFDLDPRALTDADVTVATRSNPYAPVDRHERTLANAGEARLLLPAAGIRPVETSADRVVAGELAVEMVVSGAVAATLGDEEFAEHVERMFDAGGISLAVYDGGIPYYLGLVDGTVQLGVDDESGVPQALLESDAEDVREWAEDRYRTHRSAADALEFADLVRDDEG